MDDETRNKIIKYAVATSLLSGIGVFVYKRYYYSSSSQYLVRTGLNVKDIEIGKQFMKWPFQYVQRFDITPKSFTFSIKATTKDKLPFEYPGVYTVGPDLENLDKYVKLVLNSNTDGLITGVIEGEARAAAANTDIETIFEGREEFKNQIAQCVQKQLDPYGLKLYNANLQELKDTDGSKYFTSLAEMTKAKAENISKVEVSEQKRKEDIGIAERHAVTRQKLAEIESQTVGIENNRQKEIIVSKTELEKLRAEQMLVERQAKINAEIEADKIKADREKELQIKLLESKTETERAEKLSKVRVNIESVIANAKGEADAVKIKADAEFYKAQQEAEAIKTKYLAEADGYKRIIDSFGGNLEALIKYKITTESQLYQDLARANADAIKGLNPKITVWAPDGTKAMDPINSLARSAIPMLDIVQNQTGYKLPEWIAKQEQLK